MQLPTLEYLKKNNTLIHYFGLGFIQIKIGPCLRYHFYTKELPATVEGVHNHRYSFNSTILKGQLNQYIYFPGPGSSHELFNVSCNPDEPNPEGRELIDLGDSRVTTILTKGSRYTLNHQVFHKVTADFDTITEINCGNPRKRFAQVIEPVGKKRTCPFANPRKPDELWELVSEMLK